MYSSSGSIVRVDDNSDDDVNIVELIIFVFIGNSLLKICCGCFDNNKLDLYEDNIECNEQANARELVFLLNENDDNNIIKYKKIIC